MILKKMFLLVSVGLWAVDPMRSVVSIEGVASLPFLETQRRASGFLVDKKNGLFITNAHVVRPGALCRYFMQHVDGFYMEMSLVVADHAHDMAVLRADPKKIEKMEELPLSGQDPVPGAFVKIIGNDNAQEKGKLSMKEGVFHTNATLALIPGVYTPCGCYFVNTSGGQSGSPVLNARNKVVGLHHSGDLSKGFMTLGYQLRRLLGLAKEKIHNPQKAVHNRALLHYDIDAVSPLLVPNLVRGFSDLQKQKSILMVMQVYHNRVDHYNLRVGDIIISVNGKPMYDRHALDREIMHARNLKCCVVRGGKKLTVVVTVCAHTHAYEKILSYGPLMFMELSDVLAVSLPKGSVVCVDPEGWRKISLFDGQRVEGLSSVVDVVRRVGWRPAFGGLGFSQKWIDDFVVLGDLEIPSVYQEARLFSYKDGLQYVQEMNVGEAT